MMLLIKKDSTDLDDSVVTQLEDALEAEKFWTHILTSDGRKHAGIPVKADSCPIANYILGNMNGVLKVASVNKSYIYVMKEDGKYARFLTPNWAVEFINFFDGRYNKRSGVRFGQIAIDARGLYEKYGVSSDLYFKQ